MGFFAFYCGLIYNDWTGDGLVFQASRDLADNQGGFVFKGTDGTARMVIRTNSNGRVGIGTSSPAYKLDVAGNTNVSGTLSVSGVAITEIIDDEVKRIIKEEIV